MNPTFLHVTARPNVKVGLAAPVGFDSAIGVTYGSYVPIGAVEVPYALSRIIAITSVGIATIGPIIQTYSSTRRTRAFSLRPKHKSSCLHRIASGRQSPAAVSRRYRMPSLTG